MIITTQSFDKDFWAEQIGQNPMLDIREELAEAVLDLSGSDPKTQICCGIPGMGKSTIVVRELRRLGISFARIDKVTPLGLCETLQECATTNRVVLADDADSIFVNDELLTIAQKAIYSDGGAPRTFNWRGTDYRFDGFPGFIILTNRDVSDFRSFGPRTGVRVRSFVNRCRCLNLEITREQTYLWCVHLALNEKLLGSAGCSIEQANDVLRFYCQNANSMREITVRSMLEIASIRRTRVKWERSARLNLVKGFNGPRLRVPNVIRQITTVKAVAA